MAWQAWSVMFSLDVGLLVEPDIRIAKRRSPQRSGHSEILLVGQEGAELGKMGNGFK
jgi:hypothetical protein